MANGKVLVTEIQKGEEIKLRNGFYGKVACGRKNQLRRQVQVQGIMGQETSDVYAFDIVRVKRDGQWHEVELTDNLQQRMTSIRRAGF
jgi:hypothetical protein